LIKPKVTKKLRFAIHFAVLTVMLIFFMFAAIYASTPLAQSGEPVNQEVAGSESYFQVKIAYAYVGPLSPENASYVDPTTNETMVHTSNYPSAVFLDFTAIPSMTGSCDAVIAAYGVEIVADTGPTEYYGWSAGTANYSTLTQDDFATLTRYRGDMVYHSNYQSIGGTFSYNWAADRSILSHTIGSVGSYTKNKSFTQPNIHDLSSEGTPNAISVEVYRIGYITMTNGSVTMHEDNVTDNEPVACAQLSKYEDGFIYNNIVPTEQLLQSDLWQIKTDEYEHLPEFSSWIILPLLLAAIVLTILYKKRLTRNSPH